MKLATGPGCSFVAWQKNAQASADIHRLLTGGLPMQGSLLARSKMTPEEDDAKIVTGTRIPVKWQPCYLFRLDAVY